MTTRILILAGSVLLSISFSSPVSGQEEQKLTANDAAQHDTFGSSVSMSDTVALIGSTEIS